MAKSYKNYEKFRVEPSEVAYKIYATNTDTNREELIKCMVNKARAYAYANKMNNIAKHRIRSNLIKIILHQRGISYKDFAKSIAISEDTIRRWANNSLQPSYGSILLMAQVLGIKPEELIAF